MTKVNDQVNAARPSWLTPTTVVLEVISLLALILVIIFLALPAAHPYFRRNQAVLANDPAFPNLGYPPVPGASPYPPAAPYPPAGGTPPAGERPPSDNPPSA
jgi:hypothetical protein